MSGTAAWMIAILVLMMAQTVAVWIVAHAVLKELRTIRSALAADDAKPSEERKAGRDRSRSVLSPYKDDRRISK